MMVGDLPVLLALILMLSLIFALSQSAWGPLKRLFTWVPPLLFCYFLPSLLVELGWISTEGLSLGKSIPSTLLPFCIFYFTLGLSLKQLAKLGKKVVGVFLIGSLGVVLGGPLALACSEWLFPDTFHSESYRFLSTIAGSWIGGSGNQMALNAIFEPSATDFGKAVTVDVFYGELWLTLLLFLVPFGPRINRALQVSMQAEADLGLGEMPKSHPMTMVRLYQLLGLGFAASALATAAAGFLMEYLAPYPVADFLNKNFWLYAFATILGLILGNTSWNRFYFEGGDVLSNVFLYLVIAVIGLNISLSHLWESPALLFTGLLWISTHALAIFAAGKYWKVPFHYLAIASQANVGGVASASVIATAISPRLTPIAVLLALLGYAIGTYAGYASAILMKLISLNY